MFGGSFKICKNKKILGGSFKICKNKEYLVEVGWKWKQEISLCRKSGLGILRNLWMVSFQYQQKTLSSSIVFLFWYFDKCVWKIHKKWLWWILGRGDVLAANIQTQNCPIFQGDSKVKKLSNFRRLYWLNFQYWPTLTRKLPKLWWIHLNAAGVEHLYSYGSLYFICHQFKALFLSKWGNVKWKII